MSSLLSGSGNLGSLKEEQNRQLKQLQEENRILQELVAAYKDVYSFCQELVDETAAKDARLSELEKKIADLRELYDVGTQATIASARYEELREKLLAGKHEDKEEDDSPLQAHVDDLIQQRKDR